MAELIIFISVSLILLLILIQKLTLKLIYDGKFRIEIDYSFIRIVLQKSTKKKKKSSKMTLSSVLPMKRAFDFIIERSELEVSRLYFETQEKEPHKFSVRYKNVFSLFSILVAYLSRKTKKLTINDNAIILISDNDNINDFNLDINISCPLYIALVGAAMFLLIFLKSKIQKKTKINAKRG